MASPVNLFISNGISILGIRFCYDFGHYPTEDPDQLSEGSLSYLSLWYSSGREYGYYEGEWKMIGGEDTADSMIVASEPLSTDMSTWLEVPEYGMIYAEAQEEERFIEILPLNL